MLAAMTSHSAHPPAASPSDTGPLVRVRDPGELVATLPALLGFHPRDSLIVVTTGGRSGGRAGLTLRIDLPPPGDVDEVSRMLAHTLLTARARGAAVAVVCDDPAADADGRDDASASGGGADSVASGDGAGSAAFSGGADLAVCSGGGDADTRPPPRADVAHTVAAAIEAHAVAVHTVVWASGTGRGARWRCYGPCGCHGELPAPHTTVVAAAAAVGGRVVYRDRTELERSLAPVDPETLRRREALLAARVDAALAAGAGAHAGVTTNPGVAWRQVCDALTDTAANRLVLDDARVVELICALSLPQVRDAALAACLGPRCEAALQLWAALTRESPDPESAQPAVLLAATALAHGDGALANVALDRAERAWPGHRLTAVLRVLAAAALPPDRVRELLVTACARAAREPGRFSDRGG